MRLDLGIKSRIYGGFGVLVALGLTLALLGSRQLNSINSAISGLSLISGASMRTVEISREFEIMRRAALRYKFEGNAASFKAGTEAAAKATTFLQASAKATPSEDRRKIYIGLTAEIASFREKLDALVENAKQLDAAKSTLFTAGDELTENTDKLIVAAGLNKDFSIIADSAHIDAAVLLVRVANWRFQATQDPKGPALFKESAEKANSTIAFLDKAAPTDDIRNRILSVKTSLANYEVVFDGFSTNFIKSNQLYFNEIVPQLAQLVDGIAAIETPLRKAFDARQASTDSAISNTIALQLVIAAMVLLLGGLIAFVIGHSIVGPVVAMTSAMSKLAAGNTNAEIPSRDRKDEIGAMARAVDIFKQNAIERIRLEAEQRQSESRSAEIHKAEMNELANQFESTIGSIVNVVSSTSIEMETAATTLTRTAETTQRLATAVAAASEEALANVTTVAGASEELTCFVTEIAQQVQESSKITATAVRQAENTDARIMELSQAATHISDVIKLITAIAEQTNLLALNATIEAARAGQAGKGFAVVAQEVKALATETAKAANQVSTQIAGMQTATKESVAAIKEIGATIDCVADIVSIIAAAVEKQRASTQGISHNILRAAQGTSQIVSDIAQASRGVSMTGSASAQVLESAQSLASESSHLKIEVSRFLATVRAA